MKPHRKRTRPDGSIEFLAEEETISTRHTRWSVLCQVTDIDLFLEHCHGEPLALIEYKTAGAPLLLDSSAHKAREILTERARIGYGVVEYTNDFSRYRIPYANSWMAAAHSALLCRPWSRTEWMSEDEYSGFLAAWQQYRRCIK